jgi:hypothetical protein
LVVNGVLVVKARLAHQGIGKEECWQLGLCVGKLSNFSLDNVNYYKNISEMTSTNGPIAPQNCEYARKEY